MSNLLLVSRHIFGFMDARFLRFYRWNYFYVLRYFMKEWYRK